MKLIACNITCVRGERLLFKNLHITLFSGEIIQIIGENGCGKSSLLRILASLLKPTTGEVLWNDLSIEKNYCEFRDKLFYMNHNLSIKNNLTVRENIIYHIKKITFFEEELKKALEIWELKQFENHYCRYLSQGQKQRVALAILSLSKTKLWILDEPMSSLDILGIKQLESCFEKHVRQHGSIIFATHRMIESDHLKIKTLRLT